MTEHEIDALIAIYRRLPDQDSDACTCTECTVSAVEQDPTMAGLSPAPQPGLRMASDDNGSTFGPADARFPHGEFNEAAE